MEERLEALGGDAEAPMQDRPCHDEKPPALKRMATCPFWDQCSSLTRPFIPTANPVRRWPMVRRRLRKAPERAFMNWTYLSLLSGTGGVK
jgi:hypothetical protein